MTLETIFLTYHKRLCHYASFVLKDSDDAQDVVQNVFIKFWEHKYAGTDLEVENILYRMVRNGCYDRVAQTKTSIKIGVHLKQNASIAQDDIFDVFDLAQLEASLLADICKHSNLLPNKCRRAFKLFFIKGKTTDQVMAIMNISRQNALNKKQTGLKLLRICMSGKKSVRGEGGKPWNIAYNPNSNNLRKLKPE